MSTTGEVSDEELGVRRRTGKSKRKVPLAFIIGGVVILAAVAYLIFANTTADAVYYMTVTEVRHCTTCTAQAVRVEGTVQKGSISHDDTMKELQFVISDGSQSMAVVYNGVVPDIFSVGMQVVVEGHYSGQGAFQALTLLTKCPSKFQAATPTP